MATIHDCLHAQNKAKYHAEVGVIAATDKTNPFWIRSNQYGEVPIESQVFTLRGGVTQDYQERDEEDTKKRRLQFGYGIRAVANVGATNQFLLPEAYAKAKYGAFEFYAGRRKETFGIADTTIGMGSYAWSGNALPMPKVQIGLPNYVPLLKNGLISAKLTFANGWFGSGDSTRNYMLHQKSLYIRWGKPSWRLKVYGGINHQVQWGGRPTNPFLQGGTNTIITKYGADLEGYIYIAFGIPLREYGYYRQTGLVSGEGGNRLGNHLGSIDLALEYETNQFTATLYRQSFYEDGSLFVLSNIEDGLLGFSLNRTDGANGFKKLVIEYLNTTNQGGPYQSGLQTSSIPQLRGADDYFNNATYEEGWTYKNRTIGTPFIMPLSQMTGVTANDFLGTYQPKIIIHPQSLLNTRLKAWLVALQTKIGALDMISRASYSQNLGIYYLDSRTRLAPTNIHQLSLQQQFIFNFKQYQFNAAVAYDNSGLLKSNLGLSLLVKRYF